MKIDEEFRVENKAGKQLILQKISKGSSYLDFGMTSLSRTFEGYKVKHMDRTAVPDGNGSFKLEDTGEVFSRVKH